MKVCYLILLTLGSVQICAGQRKSEQDERMNSNCLESIERYINNYADSLNFWTENMALPRFLFNPKFDQRHFFGNDCIKDRNTFSHRKAIMDRVSNIDALKAIISSKDKLLDSLYILTPEQAAEDKYYFKDFSYSTYSTRYLAERRLNRINTIKQRLSR